MSHEKAPAYQWYLNEWRGSRAVQRMTWAQKGMYREMLDEQWDKGSLPDHPAVVADLLGGTVDEWTQEWSILRRNFVDRRARPRAGQPEVPRDPDASRRIVNLRLEKQRKSHRAFVATKRADGRKGGLVKAQKRRDLQAGSAIARLEPHSSSALANPSSSSSSSSSSSTSSSIQKKERTDYGRDLFDRFWDAYPLKIAEDGAWKAWQKLEPIPDNSLVDTMLLALAWQIPVWRADENKFVPAPKKWLEDGRWKDVQRGFAKPQVSKLTAALARSDADFLRSGS